MCLISHKLPPKYHQDFNIACYVFGKRAKNSDKDHLMNPVENNKLTDSDVETGGFPGKDSVLAVDTKLMAVDID